MVFHLYAVHLPSNYDKTSHFLRILQNKLAEVFYRISTSGTKNMLLYQMDHRLKKGKINLEILCEGQSSPAQRASPQRLR